MRKPVVVLCEKQRRSLKCTIASMILSSLCSQTEMFSEALSQTMKTGPEDIFFHVQLNSA